MDNVIRKHDDKQTGLHFEFIKHGFTVEVPNSRSSIVYFDSKVSLALEHNRKEMIACAKILWIAGRNSKSQEIKKVLKDERLEES